MTEKKNIRLQLIISIWFLALGGWGLHLFIHPLSRDTINYIPFLAGLVSVILIPLLFSFKRTVAYAYVLNGMLAIIGTITMLKFKLFPDILILWGKFMVGKILFDLEMLRNEETQHRTGRFWRYPNMGWWWAHVAGLSAAYCVGYYFWN